MDELRSKDSSISRNIDHYLEELKREQAAREKRTQNERTGGMSLDDREGAKGEEDEEDWEEEYVMLDLDDIFHGAPVPHFAYTLSGLDTLNPTLTLDNGLKLIGHYMETIGTVVVYAEKEKEAQQADRWELPPPADANAVNNERRPLKRIRGVCKLERKLKFCAMPIECAPARNGMSMGDVSFMQTTGTEDASSLGNAMQAKDAMPTENASLDDARPMEDAPLENTRPTMEDESLEDTRPLEDARVMEDAPLESARPAENETLENAKLMEDVSLEHARPVEDAPSEDARPTSLESATSSK